jgi:putative lipoprotein
LKYLKLFLLLTIAALGAPTSALAQGTGACPMPYTVVAGDWLSKIAESFLGSGQAYQQIVDATNGQAATDPAYTKIDDPNLIGAGARLCVPNITGAPAGLALSDLANATYKSDFGQNGTATLKDGTYSVEAAPGSASRNVVQLYRVAYGPLNGVSAASVVTWSNGGGSGTFYDLHVMQVQDGKPYEAADLQLGDRIQLQSLKIEGDRVTAGYLDRKPDEPMAAAPTVPVTKVLALQNGQLVESQPAAAPTLSGTYYAMLPAADASGRIVMLTLAPGGGAVLATQFVGKGGPILEEGSWNQNGKQAEVQITTQSGQPAVEDFVFEPQGGQLVATQYDKDKWGSQGLTLKQVPANSLAGVYRVTEPAADAPQLVEVLFLGPEGTAAMSSDYVDKLVRIDAGNWAQSGSQATVSFTIEDGNPLANTMVFDLQGDKLMGPHGFTLTHLPASADITGSVTFAQHIGIPNDSVVTVQLVDVSIRGAPVIVLAETTFTTGGRPLPFPFDLKYDPTLIAFNHVYAVRATITVDGDVLFRSTATYPVLTNGNPSQVDMMLDKVS